MRFAFIPFYLFWSLLIITQWTLLANGQPRLPAKSLGESPSRTSVDLEQDLQKIALLLQDMTARHPVDAEWEC